VPPTTISKGIERRIEGFTLLIVDDGSPFGADACAIRDVLVGELQVAAVDPVEFGSFHSVDQDTLSAPILRRAQRHAVDVVEVGDDLGGSQDCRVLEPGGTQGGNSFGRVCRGRQRESSCVFDERSFGRTKRRLQRTGADGVGERVVPNGAAVTRRVMFDSVVTVVGLVHGHGDQLALIPTERMGPIECAPRSISSRSRWRAPSTQNLFSGWMRHSPLQQRSFAGHWLSLVHEA